jgi:diguanylate cyclase (GGDEF)-like protein
MTPPSRPQSTVDVADSVRRYAPLNSVSTRIILCVFLSTLLTALIVSWLSIGAIHNDVHARIGERSAQLLRERSSLIEEWHEGASAQLAVSAAIGSPWHDALIAALDTNPATSDLHWLAGTDRDERAGNHDSALPSPPRKLARHFDRLSLHREKAPSNNEPGCLAAHVDVIRKNSKIAGHLEGCLSRETLYDFLQPPAGDLRGMRVLLADNNGRVVAAAGIRADARRQAQLPMAQMLYPGDELLTDYEDTAGNRLVGTLVPLEHTGWFLVAEAEHARAFAPAIAITNQIFIVDICIILLFSVLAFKITLAIMQPIEALSQGAQRIAAGHIDYEIPLPANYDDELGLLTRTFNGMMGTLRSNQLEIEQDRIRLAEKNEELQRANEILSQLSITDGLTKLHNHRYFQDHLTREIKRVSRTQSPLSLILLDIDDFKMLNDTYGHAAGDEVLVSLAAIMNDSARESDLIARYGGEEFVILMPNTDLAGAVHLAEKIRMAVETTRLIIGDTMKPVDVTISLGVALFNGHRREFFADADKALYRAKAAGKNCVIIAGSEPSELG